MKIMDFENFKTDYEPNIDESYYEIEEHSITWFSVSRNTPGELRKKLDTPIRNYDITFNFNIKNIKNYGERSRMLFTLLKFWKQSGTIMSIYVNEVRSNDEYGLIFFQRKEGKNVFVYKTNKNLKVGNEYGIKISKRGFLFSLEIYDGSRVGSDDDGAYDEIHDLEGIDDGYNDIILTQGHGFIDDERDECSGIFKELIVLNIEVKIEVPEGKEEVKLEKQKAFISFCYASGNDFAFHLHKGLLQNGIDTFYSEESISSGEKFEEKIIDNVKNSTFVILIMTPGYEIRDMIKKEVKIAKDMGKLKAFKHEKLDKKHLCIKLEGEEVPYNLNDIQMDSFNTKEELFREVYYELDKEGWFDHYYM